MSSQAAASTPALALRPSRTRHVVLVLLCLLYLISYLDRTTISVAAPQIIREFHFSKTQMGLIFSAFATTYACLQIVGGTLGDRFGPRKVLALLMTWWSAFTIGTALATSFVSLFVVRMLFGLGEAGGFPVATRALSTWYPPSSRGWLQGVTHAAARLGAAMAPPVIVWLSLTLGGWRPSFVVLGVMGFVWSLAFFAIYRDSPKEKKSVNEAELREIYGAAGPPEAIAKTGHVVPWDKIFRSTDVWGLVFADFCYGFNLWIYLTWLPTYLTQARHFSFAQLGFFGALPLLGGVLGDLVGGKVTDELWRRTGNLNVARRGTIAIAFIGSLAFTLPAVFVSDRILAIVLQTAAFFFLEVSNAGLWSVSMDLGGRRYSGTVSGFMNTGFGVAGIASPTVFGLLIDRTGSWVPGFVVGVALLLLGVLAILRVDARRCIDDLEPAR
jgi:ACS family D-galactonate transporter-like MFS transporter